MNKRVAFYTLGCKVNQYDTEAMAELFRRDGYKLVDFDAEADVYVVNTCTVTHLADRKSRQVIRRARRNNPDAVVVATGCYVQTAPGAIRDIPGVDVLLGNADQTQIVDLVEDVRQHGHRICQVGDIMQIRRYSPIPIADFIGRTRATVKVQEGCNEYCTYCIIPYARGRQRSRDREDIMQEARRLVASGFREVVLAGINLSSYGQDLDETISLEQLVEELHTVDGLRRIRLSSLEPMGLTTKTIKRLARLPRLCPHLHLPLQSGSDAVLKRMKRNYTTSEYRQLVEAARESMPRVNITTDIMGGFPQETEAEFLDGLNFIRQIGFGRIHAFPYSRRKGTRAYYLEGHVTPEEKQRRQEVLLAVAADSMRAFHRRFLGEVVEVLVEGDCDTETGLCTGLTDNYIRVSFRATGVREGEFVRTRLVGIDSDVVLGRRV